MSKEKTDLPDLPAHPEIVSDKQMQFKVQGIPTQTHVTVTWLVANRRGEQLFKTSHRSLICRSDDGSLNMITPGESDWEDKFDDVPRGAASPIVGGCIHEGECMHCTKTIPTRPGDMGDNV